MRIVAVLITTGLRAKTSSRLRKILTRGMGSKEVDKPSVYHKILKHVLVVVLVLMTFCVGVYLGKSRGWPFVKRHKQHWSIGIYKGSSFENLKLAPGVTNPVLTAGNVDDIRAEFVADPFMISEQGKWYMFFEVWNSTSNQGDIGLAVSEDGLSWDYSQVVLNERFHLSYPYVFKCKNEFYMVPETSEAYSVRLYRAKEFPLKWSFEKVLIYGNYVDPSVFYFGDKWWLFASDASSDVLHLFYADNLIGPWTEHPKSPVVQQDMGTARSAGRVLVRDGRVIRFAQDCSSVYGLCVRAFEIQELSSTEYAEAELPSSPILTGSGRGWNGRGMHHIDCHYIDSDGAIACVDGWTPKLLFGLEY